MQVNEEQVSQMAGHVVEELFIDDVTLVTMAHGVQPPGDETATDQQEENQQDEAGDHEEEQESSAHERATQEAVAPHAVDPMISMESGDGRSQDVMSRPNRHIPAQLTLLGSFALDLLLYSLVVPFLPKRAADLGASPLLIGLLFASYAGGLLFATPAAAMAVERVGARTALLLGLSALLFSTICFAFASTLPLLFVARAAQGISASITWIAGLALVAQMFDSRERSAIFGRIFAVTGIGMLIGPPLGGILYSFGGPRAPFAAAVILVLLDGLGRICFLPNPISERKARDMRTSDVQEADGTSAFIHAWRALPHTPDFALGLVATIAGAATFALIEPVLPPLLTRNFHFDTLTIGGTFGFAILVFTFVQPAITAIGRRAGARALIGVGLVASPIVLGVLAFSPNVPLTLTALGMFAIAVACVLAPALEMLTASATDQATRPVASVQNIMVQPSDARYGVIYAVYNLAYAGGLLLGPILSGTLTTSFGPSWGLALPGLIPLIAGGISLGIHHAPPTRLESSLQHKPPLQEE